MGLERNAARSLASPMEDGSELLVSPEHRGYGAVVEKNLVDTEYPSAHRL